MRTRRLPTVDWTDALADLNGLLRFGQRWKLVSPRVPSRFKITLPSSLILFFFPSLPLLSPPFLLTRNCLTLTHWMMSQILQIAQFRWQSSHLRCYVKTENFLGRDVATKMACSQRGAQSVIKCFLLRSMMLSCPFFLSPINIKIITWLYYRRNQQDATWQYCLLVTARLLYMLRTLSASIIRSTKNCSSSHWSWVGMIYISSKDVKGRLPLHYVTESQRYNCFIRNGGNAIPRHAGPEAKFSIPTTGLTPLCARNPFRGNFNHWQVSRKAASVVQR